jgi:hypothetical protein
LIFFQKTGRGYFPPSRVGWLKQVRDGFVQLDNYNPEYLPIFSRDVLKRIASGDESWDQMVPPQRLPAAAGCQDRPPPRFLRTQETVNSRRRHLSENQQPQTKVRRRLMRTLINSPLAKAFGVSRQPPLLRHSSFLRDRRRASAGKGLVS